MMPEDGPDDFHEASITLRRAGDRVLCFLRAEGRLIAGAGDDVLPAIEDAFRTLKPEMKELRLPPGVLLQLPSKESLEAMPGFEEGPLA